MIKLNVSFAQEPYKRDDILQKKAIILSILLTSATQYQKFSYIQVSYMKVSYIEIAYIGVPYIKVSHIKVAYVKVSYREVAYVKSFT